MTTLHYIFVDAAAVLLLGIAINLAQARELRRLARAAAAEVKPSAE